MEQEKIEFASPAWIELAESILTDLVSTQGKPEDEFAVCEVFHNVPEHVHSEDTVAWHFHINGQSVVVGVGEAEDVDMRIVAEYNDCTVGRMPGWTNGWKERWIDRGQGYHMHAWDVEVSGANYC